MGRDPTPTACSDFLLRNAPSTHLHSLPQPHLVRQDDRLPRAVLVVQPVEPLQLVRVQRAARQPLGRGVPLAGAGALGGGRRGGKGVHDEERSCGARDREQRCLRAFDSRYLHGPACMDLHGPAWTCAVLSVTLSPAVDVICESQVRVLAWHGVMRSLPHLHPHLHGTSAIPFPAVAPTCELQVDVSARRP